MGPSQNRDEAKTLDTHDQQVAQEFRERVEQIDEELELAVAYEPPKTLFDGVFGLDDLIIRRVVSLTLARVGVVESIGLSLLITDNEGLRTLNREYRGRDEVTDVLSFPLLDAPLLQGPVEELWLPPEDTDEVVPDSSDDRLAVGSAPSVNNDEAEEYDDSEEGAQFPIIEENRLNLGDIALSRETVELQAIQAGHSPAWEFAYLLVHGVLHLVGYDDQTDAGYRAMVAHQEAVLADAGIMRQRSKD